MKRRIAVLATLPLLLLSLAVRPAAAPVRVFLRGDLVAFPDQQPVIVGGHTLVPIRGVFEKQGAQVTWEQDTKRVTVSWKGNQATVFIGSTTARVNGTKKTLDVAPRIMGDRAMVPLPFLSEALGFKADWYDRYQAAVVGERPALPVLAPADNPDLVMPCTIRVAVRPVPKGANEPLTEGAYEVKEVEMSEYVVRVLAHEFGNFPENGMSHYFTSEPLKAGAVAILMYAWAHAWNPAQPDYDLDNSLNFQVYIPDKPYAHKHMDAVRDVWGTYMVRQESGSVFAPQHGRGWYNERSKGTDWMNQRGALYQSDKNGLRWDQILQYYYRKIEFRQHPRPCAGP